MPWTYNEGGQGPPRGAYYAICGGVRVSGCQKEDTLVQKHVG